tara:strand:- start:63725 stop:64006 length:282 start_codon:yes stop_codon:yes gene_type:complete
LLWDRNLRKKWKTVVPILKSTIGYTGAYVSNGGERKWIGLDPDFKRDKGSFSLPWDEYNMFLDAKEWVESDHYAEKMKQIGVRHEVNEGGEIH